MLYCVLFGPIKQKLSLLPKKLGQLKQKHKFGVTASNQSPQRLSQIMGFYCVLFGPLKQKLSLLPKSWDSSSKNDGFQLLEGIESSKTVSENWVLLGFIGTSQSKIESFAKKLGQLNQN